MIFCRLKERVWWTPPKRWQVRRRVASTLGAIFFVFTVMIAGSCSMPFTSNDLEEDPYIIGIITRIDTVGEKAMRILVEENQEVNDPLKPDGEKIWFDVTNRSEIFVRGNDGLLLKISMQTLEIGQKVMGWTDGPIRLSYPAQGGAKRIVVKGNS